VSVSPDPAWRRIRERQFGTVNDRLVLLGAGASVEAGVPSGRELDKVLRAESVLPIYRHLSRLIVANRGYPDVERVLRLLQILAEREESATLGADILRVIRGELRNVGTAAEASAELRVVSRVLRKKLWLSHFWHHPVGGITVNTIEPSAEVMYLARLVRLQKGGTIATLNYDNCLECAGAELVQVRDPQTPTIRAPSLSESHVRVLKVHGSLDWQLTSNNHVRTSPPPQSNADYSPAIIMGAGNKLRHFGPFLDLFREFKQSLDRARVVVAIGYGFADPHITDALRLWAIQPHDFEHPKHLVVCQGPDITKLPEPVGAWLENDHFDATQEAMTTADMISKLDPDRPSLVM
jgi:hypothetical protein